MGSHQRSLLQSHLRHLEFLEQEIASQTQEVSRRLAPFDAALGRLDEIPGVGRTVAEEVVAELGTDMSCFPTAAQCCAWARLAPGNHESAGKRKSGHIGPGNRWLRAPLVQAAHAAARTKNTYLAAQYRRIAARRGGKRAAVAVAHSILTIVYTMLGRGTSYEDLGGNDFDERSRAETVRSAVKRIQRLGYKVDLTPA